MSQINTDYFLKKKWIVSALSLLLLIFLIPLLAWMYLINNLNQPMAIEDASITFMVHSGSSLTRVANELENRDLIGSSRNLRLYARIQGTADLIQTGEYELTVGMTPMEFLEKIITGDTRQYRVTLIEGWTLDQALNENHE